MLSPAAIFQSVRDQGIEFFTGVPDSLLKDFCAYVTDNAAHSNHVISANEGNAVALASGHYLGTGRAALVYMQNSGLGNAVNPLLSLADREVYALPMLLMIGWRGEPGVRDEPQHIKQGRVTTAMLDAMEIPHRKLDANTADPGAVIADACASMREQHAPVALLVRKGAFEAYSLSKQTAPRYARRREDAIKHVVDALTANDVVVATTGKTSRELYEYREARGDGHGNDFLTVGAMGHTASIAMGVARSRPEERTVCLDGDGSAIMHMGALAIIGQSSASKLLHIVINNGAHDSVGGQPTAGFGIALADIAHNCGYARTRSVSEPADIAQAIHDLADASGPAFLEIRTNKGARDDLGRPATRPVENRDALMTRLQRNG